MALTGAAIAVAEVLMARAAAAHANMLARTTVSFCAVTDWNSVRPRHDMASRCFVSFDYRLVVLIELNLRRAMVCFMSGGFDAG
jgi:hypothetical protein